MTHQPDRESLINIFSELQASVSSEDKPETAKNLKRFRDALGLSIDDREVTAPSSAVIQMQIYVEDPLDAMELLGDLKNLLDKHPTHPIVLKFCIS